MLMINPGRVPWAVVCVLDGATSAAHYSDVINHTVYMRSSEQLYSSQPSPSKPAILFWQPEP
jgi:hypothetical protein